MFCNQEENLGNINQFTILSKNMIFIAAFIMAMLLSMCVLGIFEVSRLRQQREIVLASASQLAKNSAFSFKVFDYVEIERVARESHLAVVSESYGFVTPGGEIVASFPKHIRTPNNFTCAGHLFDVPLLYAGEDVGAIRVCPLPEKYVSGEGLIAAASSALVLFLSLAFVFWIMIRRNIWRASTVMDTIRSIDPKSLTLSGLPDIVADDPVLANIHDKLLTLLMQVRVSQDGILRAQKDSAIARTTQMLAHDVRKPFSSLEMGMNLVRQAKSVKEMREMADLTVNTVQKAMITVNGLIDDVMEIGRANAPKTRPVAVESLVETVLLEIFQVHEKTKIRLDIRTQHTETLVLAIEELKVLRVFSNILGNAIHAIKRDGTLLISTSATTFDGQDFIEITLGNDGSEIPAEALPQLFEAFYTSNKEGGTGLGLAIAKKVVTAHGGRIWCESPGNRMPVEFHFTLPATTEAPTKPSPNLPLPRTSDEVYERLKPKSDPLADHAEVRLISDPREETFASEILKAVAANKQPLRIAVVDDELIYRNAFAQLLGDNQALQRAVVLTTFSSGTEALADCSTHTADAVICDIDLGYDSCNGYEVIRTLRCRDFRGTLCVHSNRSLSEDFKLAMEAGADTVFPKPMSRAHLLQILASAATRRAELMPEPLSPGAPLSPSQPLTAPKTTSPRLLFPYRFAVIEDDRMIRSVWQAAFADSVQVFASAEDLLGDGTVLEEIRDALSQFDFVVTDFYLDDNGAIPTGGMVATIVQRFHPIPVFLCSSVDWNEVVFSKLFAGRLTKFDDLGEKLRELVTQAGIPPRDEQGRRISPPPVVTETVKATTSEGTGLDIDAIYRLRHDIRNHLANLQIIARRLPEHSHAQISEDADRADLALSAIEPHCDPAIVTQMRETFTILVQMAEDDSTRSQIFRQILKLAQDLTLAHHMDEAWINPETHPLHTK